MRIRKNGKFSSLSVSHGLGVEVHQQPHFCQLNQSPWDAIPFSPDIYYQSSIHQFHRENFFDKNGSADDSVHAVEREAEAAMKKKAEANNDIERNTEDHGDIKIESQFKWDNGKSNVDGNGRECKKEQELEICDNNSAIKKSQRVVVGVCRTRARAAKKARYLSSNRQEFYYYSGFGPLWGQKKEIGRGQGIKITKA